MISFGDTLPDYFRGKFQLTATVTFTAFFSLLLLVMTAQFATPDSINLQDPQVFTFASVFFVVAVLVVAVSKRLMYLSRNVEMTYLTYLLWCFGEAVVLSVIYTIFIVEGASYGLLPGEYNQAGNIFASALLYCLVSLGIPYLIAGLYFTIEDRDNTIRLMNYGNVVSDEAPTPLGEQKITLFDNSGILKLSVSETNLYYIESDDNYIKVWYADANGVLKQYMLRCRLKTVEESFAGSDLVRCNRKYIVNMSHAKILSREKNGYVLMLDKDDIEPIPVTKTYEEHILDVFNSR